MESLYRAMTVAVAVATTFVLAELLGRMFLIVPEVATLDVDSESSAYERSDNPLLGYVIKQNFRDPAALEAFEAGYDHWSQHTRFPYTNALGQRDIERSLDPKPEGVRILLLGDSVVAGHGMLDLDDTISRQLERRLQKIHADHEVLNFGVGGYCTRAEIELLEVEGIRMHPDLVVLLFTENDYHDFNSQFAHDRPYPISRPALLNALFKRSTLFRYLSLNRNWFRFREELDPEFAIGRSSEAVGENNVWAGLKRLKQLRSAHGFPVFVAIWPHFDDTEIVDRNTIPEIPGRLYIEHYAERLGIPTIRLAPYFRSDYQRLKDGDTPDPSASATYTIGDGMHPSPTGSRVAAEALEQILAAHSQGILIPRPDGIVTLDFHREATAGGKSTPAVRSQRAGPARRVVSPGGRSRLDSP